MRYRLYHPDDFAALYAIEEVCFELPFRFGRRYMRQLVSNTHGVTWIAEESSVMAGFAIMDWGALPAGGNAYIETLEVLPSQRGKGIGGELLRRLEDSARAVMASAIWLHVDAKNQAAIRLYDAHGFRREGIEPQYYAAERDAFVYQKVIRPQFD